MCREASSDISSFVSSSTSLFRFSFCVLSSTSAPSSFVVAVVLRRRLLMLPVVPVLRRRCCLSLRCFFALLLLPLMLLLLLLRFVDDGDLLRLGNGAGMSVVAIAITYR